MNVFNITIGPAKVFCVGVPLLFVLSVLCLKYCILETVS